MSPFKKPPLLLRSATKLLVKARSSVLRGTQYAFYIGMAERSGGQIRIEELVKFCLGLSELAKIGHNWAELVSNRGDSTLLFVFGVVGVTCGRAQSVGKNRTRARIGGDKGVEET